MSRRRKSRAQRAQEKRDRREGEKAEGTTNPLKTPQVLAALIGLTGALIVAYVIEVDKHPIVKLEKLANAKVTLIQIAEKEGRDPAKDPAIARVTNEINEVTKNLMLAEETRVAGAVGADRSPPSVALPDAAEGAVHASEGRAGEEDTTTQTTVVLVPVTPHTGDEREEASTPPDTPSEEGPQEESEEPPAGGDEVPDDEPPAGQPADHIGPVVLLPPTGDGDPIDAPGLDESREGLSYLDAWGVRHMIPAGSPSAEEVQDLIKEALPPTHP